VPRRRGGGEGKDYFTGKASEVALTREGQLWLWWPQFWRGGASLVVDNGRDAKGGCCALFSSEKGGRDKNYEGGSGGAFMLMGSIWRWVGGPTATCQRGVGRVQQATAGSARGWGDRGPTAVQGGVEWLGR
jgi:hypothetical protein